MYIGSARGAGPASTWPDVLKTDPWHGQMKLPPWKPVIVHAGAGTGCLQRGERILGGVCNQEEGARRLDQRRAAHGIERR